MRRWSRCKTIYLAFVSINRFFPYRSNFFVVNVTCTDLASLNFNRHTAIIMSIFSSISEVKMIYKWTSYASVWGEWQSIVPHLVQHLREVQKYCWAEFAFFKIFPDVFLIQALQFHEINNYYMGNINFNTTKQVNVPPK